MNWPKAYVPEVGSFAEKIVVLDVVLTGHTWAEACHTAQSQQAMLASPEAFLSEAFTHLYYLSDGGYSRLRPSLETGRLAVVGTPEHCRAEMDAAMARAKELVADIEHALQSVLASVV
jgi:hypothetical protein